MSEKEATEAQAEYEKDVKASKKKEVQSEESINKVIEITEQNLEEFQSRLKRSNIDELSKISSAVTKASDKAGAVKDFENYFRPYQEKRTLLWNELGKVNVFDLPINIHAGKPNIPASYSKTIQLYFNSASNEQMEKIDRLRGKTSDLDRVERLSNIPMAELEKKGLRIPANYFTISSEAAEAKERLLILRIVTFCGIDEETANNVKVLADSRSLLDILDSWEYRCRTGYPNSSTESTQSTSQSGYQ